MTLWGRSDGYQSLRRYFRFVALIPLEHLAGENYLNRLTTLCFSLLLVSWSVARRHYPLNLSGSSQTLVRISSKQQLIVCAVQVSLVPTYQCPLSGPDPHTVSCAGRELGPVGQLAVILAGELTALSDGRHGLGESQTLADVGLRPVQLATGHSWKN